MRDAWQYHELQSELRTRFLAELRRELEALLIHGPFEASPQIERSPLVNLLLVTWYPNAIRGRATRIAREVDDRYQTVTMLYAATPGQLLDTPWDEDAPARKILRKGLILHGESEVLEYRAELRHSRQPS